MNCRILVLPLWALVCTPCFAQEKKDTLVISDVKVNFEAYVDFHYAYDANNLKGGIRPFNSNPMFTNQFGLAYAYFQTDVEYKRFFARAAFHTGEITRVMYSDEDYLNKIIRELSLTYELSDRIEFQAGIFPAIFGSETFINKDNLHATRATMTDFAPDFETGFRTKYRIGKHWQGTAQVTNGWQVIQDNNSSPAFGLVNVYDVPDKFLFNYGIFVGNEIYKSKGATDQMKIYHNLFGRVYLNRWILAPMVDFGMIRNPFTGEMDQWQSYGGSVRYAINHSWGIAARYEYMHDPNSIINELLSPSLTNGFVMRGSTATLEYLPSPEVTVRVEARRTNLNQAAYELSDGTVSQSDYFVMFSVALKMKHQSFIEKKSEPFLKSQFY
jgi:hypothetical protein